MVRGYELDEPASFVVLHAIRRILLEDGGCAIILVRETRLVYLLVGASLEEVMPFCRTLRVCWPDATSWVLPEQRPEPIRIQ